MINYRCLVYILFGAALLAACAKEEESTPEHSVEVAVPQSEAAQLVTAVESLLATLDDSQLQEAQSSLESPRRSNWSNLPAQMFPRQGARIGDMSKAQLEALYAFLKVALGPEGFRKVTGDYSC